MWYQRWPHSTKDGISKTANASETLNPVLWKDRGTILAVLISRHILFSSWSSRKNSSFELSQANCGGKRKHISEEQTLIQLWSCSPSSECPSLLFDLIVYHSHFSPSLPPLSVGFFFFCCVVSTVSLVVCPLPGDRDQGKQNLFLFWLSNGRYGSFVLL